jgi:hypothetical protein
MACMVEAAVDPDVGNLAADANKINMNEGGTAKKTTPKKVLTGKPLNASHIYRRRRSTTGITFTAIRRIVDLMIFDYDDTAR